MATFSPFLRSIFASLDPVETSCGGSHSIGRYFFKDFLRYPLVKDGVYGPGRRVCIAHAKERSCLGKRSVGLTAMNISL